MQSSTKQKIKYVFYQTFRPRTKDEYAEIFTRKSGEQSGNPLVRPVPWLYLRALALLFILFALSMLTYKLTVYSVAFVMTVAFGGIMVNVPLLIFFFELYPKRNLSLITLFTVALIGGAVTSAIILFGYEYVYGGHENPWISYIWTGFLEEFSKALFAIPAIVLLKKKDPFVCFLIGFAVGTGYSAFEDLAYIYSYSGGYYRAMWLVLMSVGRGLSCFCSHAPWTAVICWAFAKFQRPFLNYRFYLVFLSSVVLHYLADVPFYADGVQFLTGFNLGWLIEAVVVAGIVVMYCLMLKRSYKDLGCEWYLPEFEKLAGAERLSHSGNLTAVGCVMLACAFALAGCAVTVGQVLVYETFDDEKEFVSFVQDGNDFSADLQREYDFNAENYSQLTEDGEVKYASQRIESGGFDYYYIYKFGEEGATLVSVGLKYEGKVYYCRRAEIYGDSDYVVYYGYPPSPYFVSDDPEPPEETEDPDVSEEPIDPIEPVEPIEPDKVFSYFVVIENSGRFVLEDGKYKVAVDSKTEGETLKIAMYCTAGAVFAVGAVAVVILKIKARRKQND